LRDLETVTCLITHGFTPVSFLTQPPWLSPPYCPCPVGHRGPVGGICNPLTRWHRFGSPGLRLAGLCRPWRCRSRGPEHACGRYSATQEFSRPNAANRRTSATHDVDE